MNLDEYLIAEKTDPNAWWRLSSGDQQNLFEEAVERWEELRKRFPYPVELYPGCPCYACDAPTWIKTENGIPLARMNLCPRCGNKRCDGAANHINPCRKT